MKWKQLCCDLCERAVGFVLDRVSMQAQNKMVITNTCICKDCYNKTVRGNR